LKVIEMSVKTHKVYFKQGAVLATLLGCTALSLPLNAEAAVAKTSWAVSRVASSSLGSYCTMAQKYSDDTVLTLAQNVKGEYSLALDFKDKKFTEGKKQSVSIAIDGGKAKSFDVVPQTEKTAVIGIGKDADFIQKISGAGKLSVKVGSDTSDFGLSEFKAGQSEMGVCIDALQKPAEKPAAVAEDAPAVPLEKAVTSSPKPVIHKSEIAMKTAEISNDSNEPSVEGLLAAMPKPSADITPLQEQEEIIPVVPVKSKISASTEKAAEKSASLQLEVASLREENAKLSRSLAEQRKSFEDRQSNTDGAALNELKEKLEAAKAENKNLNDQLTQMSAKPVSTKDNTENLKLTESLKALQQENQTLKNQIQIYASAKDSKSVNADALAKLQAENADLKQVIASLKSAPKEATVASASDDEVNKLRADNRKLNSELDLAKTEKATLQTQAANLQKDLENKQLKMSGGSWDLEQATRRYQESQREIVRLGTLLQTQDVKCANEKKDIEYMLFDPAIATKAQISMLNSMEDQIKDKDEKVKAAEAQLASAKPQLSPDQDAKIAELQKTVAQAQTELAEKKQQLADAQTQIQKAQASQSDLASKDKDMAALKADLAQKAQQLADAQSKVQASQTIQQDLALKSQQLSDAQAKLTAASQKDAELASVKTLLSQTQAQLAMEQGNAQKIDVKAQAQQSAEQAASIAALQLQVQQANQTIIQLQNQIASVNQASLRSASTSASLAAVAPAAASMVQPASYTPAPVASAVHFKSIEEFSSLLKNAGISVSGALQQIKGGDPATYRAYSWKTDSLYGSAEMRKVSDAGQFDTDVNQYLSRAKARCKGEFAAVPSPVKASGMAQSKAYEIACVGDTSSGSASVLFTYGDQITTIVAHEGRAEAMDLAIDARDKVSSKIN
jgi:chromosome segregation ATPase